MYILCIYIYIYIHILYIYIYIIYIYIYMNIPSKSECAVDSRAQRAAWCRGAETRP